MHSSWYVHCSKEAYDFTLTIDRKLRSLRYVLMPDSSPNGSNGSSYTANRTQKSRRTYFLFIYSYVIQLVLMWFLSMPERRTDFVGAAKGRMNSA